MKKTYCEHYPEDISRLVGILLKYNCGDYLFRGHADEKYHLLPSAWR